MSSTRQLKSRIRSVKSNKQITKAMELVAASKLRRAQEATKASQVYAGAARELLTQLGLKTDVQQNIVLSQAKDQKSSGYLDHQRPWFGGCIQHECD
jgi:F-type H+-transporting ATPase subunit gamma